MSQKVMNNKTGEIFEIVSPFRSLTDLKDYKDGETYEPGTSVTSLEGYEPLESIVARCMRTMRSPNGTEYQVLDTDALHAEETQIGIYEASGASTLEEAFATADPTDSQGFDLADATYIQTKLSEELAERANVKEQDKDLSTKGTNEILNNGVSDVVGKSDSVSNGADSTQEVDSDIFPEKGK